jgi:hypothetical protein
VFNEQYRRANEAIAELESNKSRCATTLASEMPQQDEILKSAQVRQP